ncbi:hypothetical protein EJ07DRAFT_156972 [Lizonia empirigonia]|nr:hypothetical protein EJ07DRAFT_156972 [Lizonia empirigonia]
MAIHADYPRLKVEIIVGDEVLKEYGDDKSTPEPNTVERYVEAQAGTDFRISFSFSSFIPDDRDVRLDLFTDDNIVGMLIVKKSLLDKGCCKTVAATLRCADGKYVKQTLRFSHLHIEDSSAVSFSESSVTNLGEIAVKLKFGKSAKFPTEERPEWMLKEPTKSVTSSEGALKGEAKSLQLGLGHKRAAGSRSFYGFTPDTKEHFAVFRFRYRTRDLEALHIIPREEAPAPLLSEEPSAESAQTHSLRPKQVLADKPVSRHQQSSSPPVDNDAGDLTRTELIALIKHYRGNDHGLANQSTKRLQLLLKFYEDQDVHGTPTKPESSLQRKRDKQGNEESTEHSGVRKRSKP